MNGDPHQSMHSQHPYGVRKLLLGAIPGFRCAPPWAIFLSSLREDGEWLAILHDPLGTKSSFDATTGAMLKKFIAKGA